MMGQQVAVAIREHGTQLHRAGRRVDLIVESVQHPLAHESGVGAVVRSHRQHTPAAESFQHGAELDLGNCEDHRDRLDLGDHDETVRVRRLYIVARIDLTQARSSVGRSDDTAIRDVESLSLHLRRVGLHGPFQLAYRGRRGVEILP